MNDYTFLEKLESFAKLNYVLAIRVSEEYDYKKLKRLDSYKLDAQMKTDYNWKTFVTGIKTKESAYRLAYHLSKKSNKTAYDLGGYQIIL